MSKQTIIINGDNFSDIETFYVEIDNVLTKNLDWKTGHNLNAFNDLLCGGFGVFEYDETVKIIWTNFLKSKQTLGQEMIDNLLQIITGHSHIELTIVD
jgi:RNAse (barnase) inhibitor barstar